MNFDPHQVNPGLAELADRQHGPFHLRQIAAVGLSPSGVWSRVAAGRLYRIHDGVYALVPESLLTPNGHRMAAVLACGPRAGLSHYSSLKLRGLMDSSRAKIDVTVPTRNGRSRKGIQIHRSITLRPTDLELVQGIPCTTLDRTIFDMAGVLTERRLERLLDEAAYQEVLDMAALDEQIEHNRGRAKPCANLRRALEQHRPGSTRTDGPLGEEMLALIRSAGLPVPQLQWWIDLDDGEPMIQADFAWPGAKLILETDGQRAHGKPRRTTADYRRDQRAAKAGWSTLRFATEQIRKEPDRVKQTLSTVVRSRLAQQATTPQARRAGRPPAVARAAAPSGRG
jgi:hypothetical protein